MHCFIDKNIVLTPTNRRLAINNCIELIPFGGCCLEEVEYLLIHSRLDDTTLKALKHCKYIGIRALHLTSRDENYHFINRERIALMKEDSIFINTARGSLVDYKALEEAVRDGKFLGVGLDVYDKEPVLESAFSSYPNVTLTPHIAYQTDTALESMNRELLENFIDL